MNSENFVSSLREFLNHSPTPFHAVRSMQTRLDEAGFEALDERQVWQLEPNQGYYVIRNGSSIVAFRTGAGSAVDKGVRMVGAHTDSPCLKLKPQPDIHRHGAYQWGAEVYGGALLNPWFDRDLSLAGRVVYLDNNDITGKALIDFRRPVATVPSLAIHLDREANNARSINAQKDLPAVVLLPGEGEKKSVKAVLLAELERVNPELAAKEVLDFEMSLYDSQPAAIVGLEGDLLASARLDNLLSCYVGLRALLDMEQGQAALLVCNDHEEVGSMSAEGAQGPLLTSILRRWLGDGDYHRAMAGSMMVSADNAHAIHPNFADRHDENHGPRINQGPVIKVNNNQRYATNSVTSAFYRRLSGSLGLPCQTFVVRSDMACGSTIGPLTAANLGIKTLDIGVPQWGMHSIRETAGVKDCVNLYLVLKLFFASPELP
ncbi:MAG: M18 family aminopeptidase [Alteromonadaceae bacterium]|nr:M18 family aminopeptidase [Alteromonadaceae bacterium]|tara:strand:+ start:5767 stop:7062 length:1296 start_codon:yes stop_codon:yes gene_type:complete